MIGTASFSKCRLYRWSLTRRFSSAKKTLVYIGLNPSKANAYKADATLNRLLSFSRGWGYGKIVVVNLFARISSSPCILSRCGDPIGSENEKEILFYVRIWSKNPNWDLWLGWGARGVLFQRDVEVMSLLKPFFICRAHNFPKAFGPLVLGLTSRGHPRHPLYTSSNEVLKPLGG